VTVYQQIVRKSIKLNSMPHRTMYLYILMFIVHAKRHSLLSK